MVKAKDKCQRERVLRGEQVFHPIDERSSDKEIVLDPRATIIGQFKKKEYVAWLPVLAITSAKVFYTRLNLYTLFLVDKM